MNLVIILSLLSIYLNYRSLDSFISKTMFILSVFNLILGLVWYFIYPNVEATLIVGAMVIIPLVYFTFDESWPSVVKKMFGGLNRESPQNSQMPKSRKRFSLAVKWSIVISYIFSYFSYLYVFFVYISD